MSVWRLLSAWLLMMAFAGCSITDDDDGSEIKEYVRVGDRVPLFSVETVRADGTTASFSSERLTGETVIVLFNTACRDCQRELPRLNEFYLRHRGEAGFQMVAISRAEEAESVAAFWKEKGLSIPYSAQSDRRVYELFASSIIPRVYFCSADGIITRMYVEEINGELN